MSNKRKLTVKRKSNFKTFNNYREQGWDYIINPKTGELHSLKISDYLGCHNLKSANLETFDPVVDTKETPVTDIENGELVDIIDIDTGKLIETYTLNKCHYCFPTK
jgi:hypothetical protein